MQENKSIAKLTELLVQQKLIANDAQLGVVMPNPYDTPPITIPVMAPLLPGVKPCGSTDKNDSCAACDELARITARIERISDPIVIGRLIKAKNAIGDMCALIQGCSTQQSGNIAPYQDGTVCLCSAFMQLITSFIGTVNAALVQPQWGDKPRRKLTETLNSQKELARRTITECYRRYRISDNRTSQDEIIKIIKTYS
jgi:hypothetical protein